MFGAYWLERWWSADNIPTHPTPCYKTMTEVVTLTHLGASYEHLQCYKQFLYSKVFKHASFDQLHLAIRTSKFDKVMWGRMMASSIWSMSVLQECMMAASTVEFLHYRVVDQVHIQFCLKNGQRLGINIKPDEGFCCNCRAAVTSADQYTMCNRCDIPTGCSKCPERLSHSEFNCYAANMQMPACLAPLKPMSKEPYGKPVAAS